MSKGYTINFFVNVVKSAKASTLSWDVAEAVAPRGGVLTAKYERLNALLGYNVRAIAGGYNGFQSAGKTPRQRLLKALKARKLGKFDEFLAAHRSY